MNQRRYKPSLDRIQRLLLPERVEDYVGENHQICVVDQEGSVIGEKSFKHTGSDLPAVLLS